MKNTQKIENIILWLSFGLAVCIAVSEIIMALHTRSQAILFDAMYDSSELVVIGLTLFLTPLFYKPISEKHPFGFGQVECVFIIIKAFMMLAVTLGLSINSIEIVLSGGNDINERQVSVFQLTLGIVAFIVYLSLSRINKKISSPTASAEIMGWKLDVFSGFGMALAFYASSFFVGTPLEPISPYFDQIVSLIIVVLMVPTFIKMIVTSIKDVFLFAPETEIVDYVKNKAEIVLEDFDFNLEFCDITRTGRKIWISIYFSVKEKVLIVKELKEATKRMNEELSKEFEDFYVELVVEPVEKFYEKVDEN